QDRHTIEEWIMPNGSWTFAAVLDGHGGSEAAEFVVNELPQRLKDLLATELNQSPQFHLDDTAIARLLTKAITEVDSRIADDFRLLLPENFGQIAAGDVVSDLKDPASVDGSPRIEVLRALSGTTISIALIDPSKAIHVANVGDCDVFLCTNTHDGWQSTMLGSNHNCKNPTEVARIRAEHPNEEHCVVTNEAGITRVLRCLNLSRGKPLLHQLQPDVELDPSNRSANFQHSITPPYISNVPDIKHVHPSTSPSERKYLFLSSDGLVDMF
ncbi:phosphatase 2C-like domain-containing protein, partial [Rhodocollybia butyracea]